MKRYKKSTDSEILIQIKEVLKDRPTYGYKRVTAMINKKRAQNGHSRINKKRVFRVMDIYGLLFKRSNSSFSRLKKTGEIITLHSNTRWCSDAFEIHCFNGEKVYVAFSIDSHDRECLSYVAHDRPLLARDIQDLMLTSVEYRFNRAKTSRTIQWLSDRGSIYRSPETIQIGRYLGLKSCFTAPHSPESNGMSEALVNTLKRDYVYTSDCKDAKTVLKLIPKWIEDYNENAPHSGLNMKSPREYIGSRFNLAAGCDHEGSIGPGQQPGRALETN